MGDPIEKSSQMMSSLRVMAGLQTGRLEIGGGDGSVPLGNLSFRSGQVHSFGQVLSGDDKQRNQQVALHLLTEVKSNFGSKVGNVVNRAKFQAEGEDRPYSMRERGEQGIAVSSKVIDGLQQEILKARNDVTIQAFFQEAGPFTFRRPLDDFIDEYIGQALDGILEIDPNDLEDDTFESEAWEEGRAALRSAIWGNDRTVVFLVREAVHRAGAELALDGVAITADTIRELVRQQLNGLVWQPFIGGWLAEKNREFLSGLDNPSVAQTVQRWLVDPTAGMSEPPHIIAAANELLAYLQQLGDDDDDDEIAEWLRGAAIRNYDLTMLGQPVLCTSEDEVYDLLSGSIAQMTRYWMKLTFIELLTPANLGAAVRTWATNNGGSDLIDLAGRIETNENSEYDMLKRRFLETIGAMDWENRDYGLGDLPALLEPFLKKTLMEN